MSLPVFPFAPAPFSGQSRTVDAGAAFEWLRQGWAFFIAQPGIWLGAGVLVLVMTLAISIVPLFGQIAVNLLLPVFGAGMLQLAHRQAQGHTPELVDLFIGFRENAGPLVIVGLIYTAGIFGVAFLAFLLISGGALTGAITGRVGGFGIALGGVMLAGLLVMILSVPVIMATWFAPALVFLNHMKPQDAMRASWNAGVRNWVPMLVFGLVLMVCAFFASLPLGLGWLLLLPVFSAAVYASYRDIFVGI